MAVSGDVTLVGDRQGHAKLHPYLATLIRWCVSCVWSTATVFLHRLMTAPYPPIAGAPKVQQKTGPKYRAPSTDHLHPEPKVECVVLHEPPSHSLDVIFVHGLYGSLGNTWRQGDWKSKYKIDPNIIPLRQHDRTNPCRCYINKNKEASLNDVNKCRINDDYTFENINDDMTKQLNELKRILPDDKSLITEQFYNNTLLREVNVENYETQAKFVEDMFRNENASDNNMNETDNDIKCNCRYMMGINGCKCKFNEIKCKIDEFEKVNDDKCKIDENKTCEMGCGCVCDDCYSLCWPRDWIKMDFPGARVISINYTSDPYLWRPLWVKGNKRLRLHERAEQMMRQLTQMGVGEKPIIWVGHSKGGLFIKQMYCDAYQAYLNLNKTKNKNVTNNYKNKSDTKHIQNIDVKNINKVSSKKSDNNIIEDDKINKTNSNDSCNEAVFDNETNVQTEINNLSLNYDNLIDPSDVSHTKLVYDNDNESDNTEINKDFNDANEYNDSLFNNRIYVNEFKLKMMDIEQKQNDANKKMIDRFKILNNESMDDNEKLTKINDELMKLNVTLNDGQRVEYNERSFECNYFEFKNDGIHLSDGEDDTSSSDTEDQTDLLVKAGLWKNSVGFMFYSVPHRGSPLADIKTPITSRSIELLEISKDCALVLSLQERWLVATEMSQPVVRSLVETCRTLMSVLWLRIVSVDSADAGIGTLSGVSVDHREICKPSSRHCLLYKELTDLITAALNKCNCH